MALEDKEPLTEFDVDETIAEAIRSHLKEGKLPCALAFAVARETEAEPARVGRTADALEIHLSRCQLGLFGYPDKQGWAEAGVSEKPVPDGLEPAIREAATPEGQIRCSQLWELAEQFACSRMMAGYIADRVGVQIVACQLGAF